MSTYQANIKSKTANRRVKKVHSKAKFVGMLYFLGTIALAVLSCLPTILIDGAKLWIVDFWKPYTTLFSAERNIYAVVISTLYLFVLLATIINALRAFGKLGNLLRKNHKKVGRLKQNMQAMDDMGKRFSGSLAAIIIFHFLIYIISPLTLEGRPAIELAMPFAYISIGGGLFIHFFAGLIHGTVSNFDVSGPITNVVEEKRECGLFVYFFRNLVQVAAVGVILYFFTNICNFSGVVVALIGGVNPLAGAELLKHILPLLLQIVIVICLLIMIKHATAATEFNLYGMQGSGMRNFRVFSFFVFMAAGVGFMLDYVYYKPDYPMENLIIGGVALGAFLIDCIFKSRQKKNTKRMEAPQKQEEEEEEEEIELIQAGEEKATPVPAPVVAPTPISVNVPAPVVQTVQQPVYIPVYYPYSANPQTGAPAPYVAGETKTECAKPESVSVQTVETEGVDPTFIRNEIEDKLDPNKQWDVYCPECGKRLRVREVSPYHRCPACEKVFKIRKFETYARKE